MVNGDPDLVPQAAFGGEVSEVARAEQGGSDAADRLGEEGGGDVTVVVLPVARVTAPADADRRRVAVLIAGQAPQPGPIWTSPRFD